MRILYKIRRRFDSLLRGGRKADELSLEIEQHLEMEIAELVAEGMNPKEARQCALREFGNVESLKGECRDVWGTRVITGLIQDLRFGFRLIRSSPWFSVSIVITLALGIGMNTVVFTLVNSFLLKPVSVPTGENIVALVGQDKNQNNRRIRVSYPDFQDIRERNNSFEELEGMIDSLALISENGNPPSRVQMANVSTEFFRMLQISPILGYDFSDNEDKLGRQSTLIISYNLWRDRYAEDPNVIGKNVNVNGKPATIIGVMPKAFEFPIETKCWMPIDPNPQSRDRSNRQMSIFGILKSDTNIEKAAEDISLISRNIAEQFPDSNGDIGYTVSTFRNRYDVESELVVLFSVMQAAVGLVLLIVCVNVSNMMLGRAIGRRTEFSIRGAVGASRLQLVRQLLTESVVLSVIGGLIGLVISIYSVHFLNNGTLDKRPSWMILSMDYTVYAYFAFVTILSGILFGLAPAVSSFRGHLYSSLKVGTSGTVNPRGRRFSGALVVLQYAFTVMLLANAGLMILNYKTAQKLNDFVPMDEILTARIDLPAKTGERYFSKVDRVQFFEDLTSRLRELPGVVDAVAVSSIPGITDNERRRVEIYGRPVSDIRRASRAIVAIQTPQFLSVINLPILEGRELSNTDGEPGNPVAVVTKKFAERHWPNQSGIGKRFRFVSKSGAGQWTSIVGVSADIIAQTGSRNLLPLIFVPHKEEARGSMSLLIHSSIDPYTHVKELKSILQDIDRDLPLSNVKTVQEVRDRNSSEGVIIGSLFGVFGLIALLITSIGIYTVVAQATRRRSFEIGVRMALGASPASILNLVLSRGIKQLLMGLAIGLLLAIASSHVLEGMLASNMSATNPIIIILALAILIVVGVAASWIPARKAIQIDPIQALRSE